MTGEYTEYYHEPGWATDQYNKAWECAAMDMHELVSESFDGDDLIDFTDEDQVSILSHFHISFIHELFV